MFKTTAAAPAGRSTSVFLPLRVGLLGVQAALLSARVPSQLNSWPADTLTVGWAATSEEPPPAPDFIGPRIRSSCNRTPPPWWKRTSSPRAPSASPPVTGPADPPPILVSQCR